MSSSDDDFEQGFLTPKNLKPLSREKFRGSKTSKAKSLFNNPTKLQMQPGQVNEKCKVCLETFAKLQLKSHYALKHPEHLQKMKDKLKEKQKTKQSGYYIGQNSRDDSGKASNSSRVSSSSQTSKKRRHSPPSQEATSKRRRYSSPSQEAMSKECRVSSLSQEAMSKECRDSTPSQEAMSKKCRNSSLSQEAISKECRARDSSPSEEAISKERRDSSPSQEAMSKERRDSSRDSSPSQESIFKERRDSSRDSSQEALEDSECETIDPTVKSFVIDSVKKIAGVKDSSTPAKPSPQKKRKKAERSCKCTNCNKAPCQECKQCRNRNKCIYKKCLNPSVVKVKCPKCLKDLTSKYLKVHLQKKACQRTQHPKIRKNREELEFFFECPLEKKKFRSMEDASDHWERRHEDEGELRVFAKKYHCKVCNHITLKRDTMHKHLIRKHPSDKQKESEK